MVDGDEFDPFDRTDPGDGAADLPGFGLAPEEAEVVRAANGDVQPIVVPANFSEITWRRALTVYHQFFDQNGRVPAPREAYALWPSIPEKTYAACAAEDEFIRALELRGISADPTEALTDLQHLTIMKLTDPSDRRTERAKLSQLGVSWPRYQGWLKNPAFVKAKNQKVEEMFADVADVALMRLRGNVEAGEQRAVEFALAASGRYNPANLAIEDARQVILLIVEAVMRRVDDPAVRQGILDEVRALSAGFDLNNRRTLGH